VCLAHDLGHPPFGHAGEHLLNELMDSFGGFEGNAQTLRLLTETIWHSTSPGERVGLNATRALLDGVLKYKRPRSEVESKNHFIYDNQMKHVKFVHGAIPDREILSTSVECQIMDWADDIAYSVGDVVDGVHARFITPDKLRNWRSEKRHEFVIEELLRMLSSESINRFAGRKIGEFIEACQLKMSHADPVLAEKSNRYRYVLKVRDDKRAEQECLKQVSIDLVFASPTVRQLEYKAQEMLRQLFEILKGAYVCEGSSKRRLLNEDIELMFHSAEGIPSRARVLCDHISGMSDDYAVRTFRRLVEPEFGSIVDLV
jgi:dGTPase